MGATAGSGSGARAMAGSGATKAATGASAVSSSGAQFCACRWHGGNVTVTLQHEITQAKLTATMATARNAARCAESFTRVIPYDLILAGTPGLKPTFQDQRWIRHVKEIVANRALYLSKDLPGQRDVLVLLADQLSPVLVQQESCDSRLARLVKTVQRKQARSRFHGGLGQGQQFDGSCIVQVVQQPQHQDHVHARQPLQRGAIEELAKEAAVRGEFGIGEFYIGGGNIESVIFGRREICGGVGRAAPMSSTLRPGPGRTYSRNGNPASPDAADQRLIEKQVQRGMGQNVGGGQGHKRSLAIHSFANTTVITPSLTKTESGAGQAPCVLAFSFAMAMCCGAGQGKRTKNISARSLLQSRA